MNRIDIDYSGERYFANGVEVSHAVWCKAIEQNDRILKRRNHLRKGTFVRPWNKLDPRNEALLKALERHNRSVKHAERIVEGYGRTYRVDL